MNQKLYRIFKIISPILAIVEFTLVTIHYSIGLSSCEYRDLMKSIRNNINRDDSIDRYYDVFCHYSDYLGRLIGLIILTTCNLASLIISFIGIIFSFITLCKNKHCILVASLIFFIISTVVAFVDFMVAVCKDTSLSDYSYFPSDLVSRIENTLDEIKEKKIELIVLTLFFLLVSIGGTVINAKILKFSNNEENTQPNVYQGLQYQYNPQQNFVNNNNINYNISNNNYNMPTPIVQENMYQQTNS